MICCAVTTFDSVWVSVLTAAVSPEAVTSTVVEVPVTFNWAEISFLDPTSTWTCRVIFLKTGMFNGQGVGRRWQVGDGVFARRRVVVLRVNPVVVDTTVTVAPGTTALLVSVTVPEISPVSAWPKSHTELSSNTLSTAIDARGACCM